MRIGAVTTAFNEEKIIAGTIECLAPFVDKHYVLLSEKSYYGNEDKPDRTEEICDNLGAYVVKDYWPLEHLQRNHGAFLCSDCDWILWFDADEMMTYEELDKVVYKLETLKHEALAIMSKVYWKNCDYRLEPYPDHHKIIATRPNVEYYDRACMMLPYYLLTPNNEWKVTHHHLSYAEPKDILSKVRNYSHSNEFDGVKWYNEHFINWKPGDKAIQPNGSVWEAVYDPLPNELRKMIGVEAI